MVPQSSQHPLAKKVVIHPGETPSQSQSKGKGNKKAKPTFDADLDAAPSSA